MGTRKREEREAGGVAAASKSKHKKREGRRCLIGAELALAAVVYRRGNLTPSPPILFLLRSALK